MAVEKISTYSYHCDVKDCIRFQVSNIGRPSGWGLVRVYDHKWKHDEIGDQNGWNNFDMCPEHYQPFMVSLGIDPMNIPDVPDDAG